MIFVILISVGVTSVDCSNTIPAGEQALLYFRGMNTLSEENTLSNCFIFPSEKGSPLGSIFFHFRVDLL